MDYLLFDEIIRDLLVNLRGRIPILTDTQKSEEAIKQINEIASVLKESLNKLDEAEYQNKSAAEDIQKLQNELKETISSKSIIEEKLKKQTEDNNDLTKQIKETKEKTESEKQLNDKLLEDINKLKQEIDNLNEKQSSSSTNELNALKQQLQVSENNINDLQKTLEETKADSNAKDEEIISLKETIEKLNDINNFPEYNSLKEQLTSFNSLQSENSELKDKLSSFENLQSENAELKDKLANFNDLQTENSNLKDKLVNLDDLQAENSELKDKLISFDKLCSENTSLKETIKELENKITLSIINENSKKDAYEEAIKKADLLSQELNGTQQIVKILYDKVQNQSNIEEENLILKKRITDLDDTLKTIIQAQAETELKYKGKFPLSSEDCTNIFETLSLASSRLEHSLENKDLFQKICYSLKVFEHSNAIRQIQTIGEEYNPLLHKVTTTYLSDDVPDNMVIYQESGGFTCADKIIQKARVWIAKSKFVCSDCGNNCRPHEFFCPKCGLEITSPDGTGKRNLLPLIILLKVRSDVPCSC